MYFFRKKEYILLKTTLKRGFYVLKVVFWRRANAHEETMRKVESTYSPYDIKTPSGVAD